VRERRWGVARGSCGRSGRACRGGGGMCPGACSGASCRRSLSCGSCPRSVALWRVVCLVAAVLWAWVHTWWRGAWAWWGLRLAVGAGGDDSWWRGAWTWWGLRSAVEVGGDVLRVVVWGGDCCQVGVGLDEDCVRLLLAALDVGRHMLHGGEGGVS